MQPTSRDPYWLNTRHPKTRSIVSRMKGNSVPEIAAGEVGEQESDGFHACHIGGILNQAHRYAGRPARGIEVPLPRSNVSGLEPGGLASNEVLREQRHPSERLEWVRQWTICNKIPIVGDVGARMVQKPVSYTHL